MIDQDSVFLETTALLPWSPPLLPHPQNSPTAPMVPLIATDLPPALLSLMSIADQSRRREALKQQMALAAQHLLAEPDKHIGPGGCTCLVGVLCYSWCEMLCCVLCKPATHPHPRWLRVEPSIRAPWLSGRVAATVPVRPHFLPVMMSVMMSVCLSRVWCCS